MRRDLPEKNLNQGTAPAETAASLADLMRDAPVAFGLLDSEFRYVQVNEALAAINRLPAEAHAGRHVSGVIGPDAWRKLEPLLKRALTGEVVRNLEEGASVPQQPGATRWFLVSCFPVASGSSEAPHVGVAITDITERKQAERRRNFLADLTERTRAILDPDALVAEVVHSVGRFLGVSGYMYGDVDPDAGMVTVHRDYCAQGVSSVAGVWSLAPWGEAVVRELAAGRTVVNRDSSTDPRTAGGYEAIYKENGIRANVTVPLHRSGKWAGVFSAQMQDAPRDWTSDEIDLLETVAHRMWLALENARLYRAMQQEVEERARAEAALRESEARFRRIADTLQQSQLYAPPEDAYPGLLFRTWYEPAWQESEVGGDFYDAFSLGGGKVALVVGDICGKGLLAAARVAETRSVLRLCLRESKGDPAAALTRLNDYLCAHAEHESPQPRTAFETMLALAVAVLDGATGTVTVSVAGAEPPLILRAQSRSAEIANLSGPMLGVTSGLVFESMQTTLADGDLLIMVTDGVTEARRGKEFFGPEGVAHAALSSLSASAAATAAESPLESIGQAILDEARQFAAGGRLRDDACLLIARRVRPSA